MKKIMMISFLLTAMLFAELKVGENFPSLTLVDQFDKKMEVNKDAKVLLSFEKDISFKIKEFLDEQEKDYLSKNNTIYISDISSMPSIITSWFAIPKMKKFPFQIALIYDEDEAERLSREEGKVTVVTLKENVIESIEFVVAEELGK